MLKDLPIMLFTRTIHILTLVEFLFATNLMLCHAEQSSDHHTETCGNHYSEACNVAAANNDLTDEEMFNRGHMKPFGSHRPPDYIVEELPYMISPQDFYMNYVVKHKPVVFKGAVKHWPAYIKWTDEYLNTTYGSERFRMETKDDDKWNIPPDMRLDEFLNQYNQSNRYLVDEVLPDMRKDVVLPLCLRCEEMSSYFFVSYFWMSTGGTSSSIHIDTDENLLCVIHGHKAVLMVSPVYSTYLYSDEARVLGVSDINPQAVDLEKYPNVMKVRYHSAMVEEGDIVYIPQMWWHQVISRPERQQAVALWWKSKPAFKNPGRLASPLELKSVDKEKYSFGNILAEYEFWVQNVSDITPRPECRSQQMFMSDYQFETDKSADHDAPQTQSDGGYLEEELLMKASDRLKPENKDLTPCDFDYTNKKSPCHFSECWEDDNNHKCIRYILDYCIHYDDRGCVDQLPQLMNKLASSQYKEIQQMPSDF